MTVAVRSRGWDHDVEALRPYLVKFARAKLSDEHTVEDVVQETMLVALSGKTPFLGRSSLRTWLTSILNFKIIDTYRKFSVENSRRKPQSVHEDDGADLIDGFQSLSEQDPRLGLQDPSEAIARRQLSDCVMAAIQSLPAKQRDAFVLVQMHGYSGDDAAKAMGLSHANVWVILHRARKMLRLQLRDVYH